MPPEHRARPPTDLARRLRLAIPAARTIRDVAADAQISEAMMYRYLQGTPIPSDRLQALAAACGVSIAWLFGEAD